MQRDSCMHETPARPKSGVSRQNLRSNTLSCNAGIVNLEVNKPKGDMVFLAVRVDSLVKGGHLMNNGPINATSQSKVSPPIIIKKRHREGNSPQAVTVNLPVSGPMEKDGGLGGSVNHEFGASDVDGRKTMKVQNSNG